MGLWDSIRGALGWRPPLVVRDGESPLALTDAARAHLSRLPAGVGIHLEATPVDGGAILRVDEGPLLGPPPAALAGLPITAGDATLHDLRGLALDHRDERWALSLDLDVRARETPNPNGRLYLFDRVLSEGPSWFRGAGPHPPLAGRLLAIPGVTSVLLRDHTATMERAPGLPWEPIDAAVDAEVRGYFLRCGHPLRAADLPARADGFEEEVVAVLRERVLPGIHRDGGDLELVGVSDGVVRVSMVGACRTCPASTATLRLGVEKVLKEALPGRIERVEQV